MVIWSKTKSPYSMDEFTEFLFVSPQSLSVKEVLSALSSLAVSGSALMGLSGGVVSLACIPVIVPMTLNRITDSAVLSFLSDDAKNFIKGITYVSMGQGSLAMIDFMFGDLLSGFMKAIFAAMGFYVSQMDDGVTVIPSFTVVSFVNGCITLLSAFEQISARHTPMFSGLMPMYLNYIHFSQLLHPMLCFAGAYMGWQIIKELRRGGTLAPTTNPVGLFPSEGVATQAVGNVQLPRVLAPGGGSFTGGFTPFTGRGHSLSMSTS